VQHLQEGVTKFGHGNWAKIRSSYPFPAYRTGVHLKDKWRNHEKAKAKLERHAVVS